MHKMNASQSTGCIECNFLRQCSHLAHAGAVSKSAATEYLGQAASPLATEKDIECLSCHSSATEWLVQHTVVAAATAWTPHHWPCRATSGMEVRPAWPHAALLAALERTVGTCTFGVLL